MRPDITFPLLPWARTKVLHTSDRTAKPNDLSSGRRTSHAGVITPRGFPAQPAQGPHPALRSGMTEESPASTAPRLCVLAAEPLLTVTIEASGHELDVPEVHVHAGGQGLWISRMAASLGATVTVCGPFGGETGSVVAHLAGQENIDVRTTTGPSNGAYVHDRRDGERRELARMPSPSSTGTASTISTGRSSSRRSTPTCASSRVRRGDGACRPRSSGGSRTICARRAGSSSRTCLAVRRRLS